VKVGDLIKKVSGIIDLGMIGVVINTTRIPSGGFREKISVWTTKGIRQWMTNSFEVINESR